VLSWIPAARIVERSNASELLDGFEAAVKTSVYTNWCALFSSSSGWLAVLLAHYGYAAVQIQ
jgi:hypothetical protein